MINPAGISHFGSGFLGDFLSAGFSVFFGDSDFLAISFLTVFFGFSGAFSFFL